MSTVSPLTFSYTTQWGGVMTYHLESLLYININEVLQKRILRDLCAVVIHVGELYPKI